MLSPSPSRLKQTFSKGPAQNTRSSTACTRTSKSAPNVPPDPGEHNLHPSTPSNRPSSSSTSFIHPSTSFNSPSSTNKQQSSSPSSNIPPHSTLTSSPFKSLHHSNNRFSAFEEPSTSDQLDTIDEHIHHVETNMLTMAKDISNYTDNISTLATAIDHLYTMLEKIVPTDEIDLDDKTIKSNDFESQQQSHQQRYHNTTNNNNNDKDLSFESELDTNKQNSTPHSYAHIINNSRNNISYGTAISIQRTNPASSHTVSNDPNTVSNVQNVQVLSPNSARSQNVQIFHSQTKSRQNTALENNLTHKAPFTCMEIYESFTTYSVPSVPTRLLPSKNIISSIPELAPTFSITSNNVQSMIAASVNHTDETQQDTNEDNSTINHNIEEWYNDQVQNDPVIGAIQRKNEKNSNSTRNHPYCHCCMTPDYTADHCFLHGKAVRPKLLNKRHVIVLTELKHELCLCLLSIASGYANGHV